VTHDHDDDNDIRDEVSSRLGDAIIMKNNNMIMMVIVFLALLRSQTREQDMTNGIRTRKESKKREELILYLEVQPSLLSRSGCHSPKD